MSIHSMSGESRGKDVLSREILTDLKALHAVIWSGFFCANDSRLEQMYIDWRDVQSLRGQGGPCL